MNMRKKDLPIANENYVKRWYAMKCLFDGFFTAGAIPAAIALVFIFAFSHPPQDTPIPHWGFIIIGGGAALAVALWFIGLLGRITLLIFRRFRYKIWTTNHHPEWT